VISNRQSMMERMIADGGGMTATTGGLGLFVSAEENVGRCPDGWVFLPIEQLKDQPTEDALDLFSNSLDSAQEGREVWPQKED
jgi:hypothetical protein